MVFKDGPVFFGVDQTAFVLKGFGICLKVNQGAGVLPERQDFGDRGFTPFAGCILALFTALADALAFPILRWSQDTVLLQQPGRSFDPVPFYTKPVNPADYLGGFIVDNPLSRIVRVLFVTVRRKAHGVAGIAAQFLGTAYFSADILCVPLVHDVAEGREIIVALVAVHTVVYGNEADVMLWKIGVGVIANLQIVPPQAGHILYDHSGYITGLYILQHLLKAGTVEIRPGIPVVHIKLCVGKMMLFCVLGKQFFLRSDLSRVLFS